MTDSLILALSHYDKEAQFVSRHLCEFYIKPARYCAFFTYKMIELKPFFKDC